jgi:hypothetical protein
MKGRSKIRNRITRAYISLKEMASLCGGAERRVPFSLQRKLERGVVCSGVVESLRRFDAA